MQLTSYHSLQAEALQRPIVVAKEHSCTTTATIACLMPTYALPLKRLACRLQTLDWLFSHVHEAGMVRHRPLLASCFRGPHPL